ncbi:MAG: hypothetical protein FWD90_06730 [Defluviitaleaceae bacterium]|nr:hypothetical protein [Defluviitaleaceae bacterium]
MDYIYSCQKKAMEKRGKIVFIPENTTIKKECLVGVDNEAFVKCFRHMQEMVYHVYDDMITHFSEYGIKGETNKDGHFNLVSCFGDVLYQIALLGELSNGMLVVNINRFKEKTKKHKYNLIINRLRDNGFDVTNHNGKVFIKGEDYFTLSYPDMPEVVNVLKSYALLMKGYLNDIKPSYLFYMTDIYNFANFQYRFVEDETTRKYSEPVFMTVIDLYSENGKKSLCRLYDEAGKFGYTLDAGLSTVLDFKKDSKTFLSLNEDENKKINTRIILRKVTDKHMKMLYALPDYLQKFFTVSTCSYCDGRKSTDGKCNMRIDYNWHGQPMRGCAYHSFKFNDIKYEDLPLILDLFKMEFNI